MRKGIELIGGFQIKDGMKIVIKPNLSDLCSPETGVTTHPIFVEALIRVLNQIANVKIYIVESDHWAASADEEFEYLGYSELTKKYYVTLINLSKDKKIKVQINGKHLKRLEVPVTLLFADKFISVAKVKTHSMEVITCVLKNQFGLLTSKYKSKYHPYLSEVLTDLNDFYLPDLCIADGIIGMEGKGPTDGNTCRLGVVIMGKDPVATDAVAAKVMGFNPNRIPHLKFAEKSKVGTFHFSEAGDPIKCYKALSTPTLVYRTIRTALFLDRHYFPNAANIFYILGGLLSSQEMSRKQKLKLIFMGAKRIVTKKFG